MVLAPTATNPGGGTAPSGLAEAKKHPKAGGLEGCRLNLRLGRSFSCIRLTTAARSRTVSLARPGFRLGGHVSGWWPSLWALGRAMVCCELDLCRGGRSGLRQRGRLDGLRHLRLPALAPLPCLNPWNGRTCVAVGRKSARAVRFL